ncbi:MAG: serine acetyltransferase [Planctomycetota bacterium]
MSKTETRTSSKIALKLIAKPASTKPRITDLVRSPILSCSSIQSIVNQLKQILFPGFCDAERYPAESLSTYLEINIESVTEKIAQQIAIAKALDNKFSNEVNEVVFDENINTEQYDSPSRELAEQFIGKLPQIRETLSTDIQAAYDGDPACKNSGEVILCYPGFQAVMVHRFAHEFYKMAVPYLPRMMAEWVHGETGIDIHPGASIGDYFFIDHGTGVVIGETCVIGNHVKIYQGVTLGALSFPTDGSGNLVRDTKRHPTIQDNVVIYANVTVLGGRTIVGHDSVIGSSVWLTKSVDPFTAILMEKPKLHLRDETPNDFQPPLDYQI